MPNLQPPGAGLPGWENTILKVLFRFGCLVTSDEGALAQFEREADKLIAMFDAADLSDASDPVLIGRITGIEDSSRNWSLMMVLEHLSMVNRDILKVIDALQRNIMPRGELAIELYKPESDLDVDVLDRFKDSTFDFLETVRAHGRLRTHISYAHPWFGELNAHAWNCLAAAHIKIHRKQGQAIMAKLGIV